MMRYPPEHWDAVARVYASDRHRPAVAVAEQFGVPLATARRWFREMRQRGQLATTSHGRTSEEHERIERLAAELGVERHEFARAVLRHFPNGKLYIKPSDTHTSP